MIDLDLYPIFCDNRKSLRETSKDESNANGIQRSEERRVGKECGS